MSKLKVAIVGIGHLGSKHLKTYTELSEKVEIVAVCDRKEDRTQRLASHYSVPFTEDYTSLIGKIDAVNICVPTTDHFKISKFFLENNVHTFVEKPITTTLKEADILIKTAKDNNLKLQVGHIERFNAAFESIKHFTIDPLFIECHRLNHFPHRSLDIGVVLDLMIHDIDIMLGIVSSPIKNIHAVGVNVLTPLEDIANVRISFENGCVCNLTASRVSEEVMRKIRIFQKDTYISLDYVQQEAFIYKRHEKTILKHSLPIEKKQPLKKELNHFVDCVTENQQPLISGKEGREALAVVLDILQKIDNTAKK